VNETLPPDPASGIVAALGTLRHALADPLSAAGLKLELVERRLSAASGDGPSLAVRIQSAKADLAIASRLIDLLPRLAKIAGESPRETSIGDLCRLAGVLLEDEPASTPRLMLRRLASVDALRAVASSLRPLDPTGPAPRARLVTAPGGLSLRIEGSGHRDRAKTDRLLGLPRGDERAEELFLARACIEADGGVLELGRQEEPLVATASWPGPAA
jgi:hypothetical protein